MSNQKVDGRATCAWPSPESTASRGSRTPAAASQSIADWIPLWLIICC
ncbi:hypothetical protein ACFYNO_00990 [Kitasatospora sp. NPDC006697]